MNTINQKINIPATGKKRVVQSKQAQSTSFKATPVVNLITKEEQKVFDIFSQNYGSISERIGLKLGKLATDNPVLKKSSRFVLEKGVSSIKQKSGAKSFVEHAVFPLTRIPMYIANWFVQVGKKIPGIKNGANKVYGTQLFRVPRKLNELDAKTDIIKGMYDKTNEIIEKFAKENGKDPKALIDLINNPDKSPETQKLVKDASNYIKENLYRVSNKFFDRNTGNFNTAYERPLNRIVTGLIPVAFLANDAYNLSVLCGDKKADSQKEAKERSKQEISRVFMTAYIQLISLGTLTKAVNQNAWVAPAISAFTVFFSEIFSRKRLGKPVVFLNKEKAKEYNKREKAKEEAKKSSGESSSKLNKVKSNISKLKTNKEQNAVENKQQPLNTAKIENKTHKVFEQFTSSFAGIGNDEKTVKEKEGKEKAGKEKAPEKEKKALINFKTLKNGVGILLTAGFVLSFLKNSSLTKNTKLVKGIQNLGKKISKKIYSPLTSKNFEMSQKDFQKITDSLKDAGCKEIAQGHEYIKNKYAETTADGIIKVFKSSLPDDKKSEVLDIVKGKLKGVELADDIVKSVSTAIKVESNSIAENNFAGVSAKMAEILKNKGINIEEAKLSELMKTIEDEISSRVKKTQVRTDRKILKPIVHLFIEPFKFIFSAARLPFKIVSSLIRICTSGIDKKISAEELGQLAGDKKITKLEKGIHKAVTEVLGEKKQKSGSTIQNIFVNTMNQMADKTKGYQNALTKHSELLKAGNISPERLQKAQNKLETERKALGRYVNNAVEKSFNGVTQSSNKNTDIAMMTKLVSSAVTSVFLVKDNYNMVMIKSDGENKEEAKEKANERIVQRLSALFYQTMIINLFNSLFRGVYNGSLKGMSMVSAPNTLATEIITRKSIGMPVGRKTYEQLVENEEKNENRKGFLGKYFKFMRLLTGKKPLKDRMPKNKTTETIQPQLKTSVAKENKNTNLLKKYIK